MKWILGTVPILLSSVLIMAATAASGTTKQRIAIEEKGGTNRGAFTLVPLTPGPIKADSGTWAFLGATQQSTVVRNGQTVKRFRGTDAFEGKRGTFRIPTVSSVVDAGGGFFVGTQTWSIRGDTGVYAGISGGGAGAFVATPQGGGGERLEGYVTTG